MYEIKVLIIEDNPFLRNGIEALLNEQSDIKVIKAAADFEDVASSLSACKNGVVLLDVSLHDQNSLRLTEKLSSEDILLTLKSTVKGIVKGASEVGGDVGKTAVTATQEAIKAAGEVGADVGEVTKQVVTGAIEAADEIGSDASKAVRNVLKESIKGAKDIIKEPFK